MLGSFLSALDRALGVLERGLLAVSMAALLAIAVLILMDIAGRWSPLFHIPDNIVIVQQLMTVSISCGLGYVTAARGHIAIDLFYTHLGPRARRACDLLGGIAGLIAFAPIAIWVGADIATLYDRGTYFYGELRIPQWPVMTMFLLGLASLSLRLAMQLAPGRSAPAPAADPV